MTNLRLLTLTAVFSASILNAQFQAADMMKAYSYTNETGEVANYRMWAPQFPQAGVKYPVILFLHGSGECGTDNLKQIKVGVPKLLNGILKSGKQAIVIAPQCQRESINCWVRRIAFTEKYAAEKEPTVALESALEIANHVIATRNGDPDRLIITGLSLGGFGTWDAIQRDPTPFAAAAPICGGGDVRLGVRLKKIPLWVAHGALDKNVSVECSRRMVAVAKANGNKKITYIEYPKGGHFIWDQVYSDPKFIDWLFKQTRLNKPWWKFW